MTTTTYNCERCGERLNPRTMAWLELDQNTNLFHDGPIPEGHTSQGGFPFGVACAAAVLKAGGKCQRIRGRA